MVQGPVLVVALLSALAGPSDERLLGVSHDAQAASRAPWARGALSALLENEYPGRGTVSAEIEAAWDGSDVYMLARIGDTAGVLFRDQPAALADSREHRILIVKDTLQMHNPETNVLHLHKSERNDILKAHGLLEVIPATNWSKCCPPWTGIGSSWGEILSGARSRMHGEGSTISARLIKPNVAEYVRDDPGFGKFRASCALDLGGNVTAYEFLSERPSVKSQRGGLTWRKEGGVVVLAGRTHEENSGGLDGKVVFRSRLKISSVRLSRTRSPLLSIEHFRSQLPPDALVTDHVLGTTTPLKPRSVLDADLRRLGGVLRSGGFLKGR
jgi:hypothetical protein